MYKPGEIAPNLAQSVVVHFPDYAGKPFFVGAGRGKWVPIPPIVAEWFTVGEHGSWNMYL